jgi:hypothetical protein
MEEPAPRQRATRVLAVSTTAFAAASVSSRQQKLGRVIEREYHYRTTLQLEHIATSLQVVNAGGREHAVF